MPITPLASGALFKHCDPNGLDFTTTAELEESNEFIGQSRAVESLLFGIGIRQAGYNIFALGSPGTGKKSLVERYSQEQAAREPVPDDWCYVFDFNAERRPRALRLPPGRAIELAHDMDQLLEDLISAIPKAFDSDEYHTRSESIEEALSRRQEKAMSALQADAQKKGIVLIRTPAGFTLGPMRDGKPITPDEFRNLPEEERNRIEKDTERLQETLRKTLHQAPKWEKESRRQVNELNREMARSAVSHQFETLRAKYTTLVGVISYFDQVEADIIENFLRFLPKEQKNQALYGMNRSESGEAMPWSNRYRVNTLLADDTNGGAPVIYEDHPTFTNLFGRIEHRAQQGALVTDFTMIRAGALHHANGGYLIVDALRALSQPFVWETLIRTLKAGEIRIEALGQAISLISTVSLEPEPIPLHVKVILLGERMIYYLLAHFDTEFEELFKVQVDFDDRMDRIDGAEAAYAQVIASLVRKNRLLPFERGAVARVIEFGARLADDQEKLSTHMRRVEDLVRESHYWTQQRHGQNVSAIDVQQAIDTQIRRSDRLRERVHEGILRGDVMIDSDGERTGQVNGLAVISLGSFSFGTPSRISARTRVGDGQVLDIEREVEMGGPIHSKGVLILSSFLAARYAAKQPLSLSASLVFEQSYGGVEGDSASSAELYALLSALADAPIKQSLAVTGSVNQYGEIQAIGGVNEKIEGFFDICMARGLTGNQGVLVPATNTKHLMLRKDVIDAVAAKQFAVYPVSTIDEGIELLTEIPAGERDRTGKFPTTSINGRIEQCLINYSKRMRAFASISDTSRARRGRR